MNIRVWPALQPKARPRGSAARALALILMHAIALQALLVAWAGATHPAGAADRDPATVICRGLSAGSDGVGPAGPQDHHTPLCHATAACLGGPQGGMVDGPATFIGVPEGRSLGVLAGAPAALAHDPAFRASARARAPPRRA